MACSGNVPGDAAANLPHLSVGPFGKERMRPPLNPRREERNEPPPIEATEDRAKDAVPVPPAVDEALAYFLR